MNNIVLNNQISIPQLGFGVYKVPNDTVYDAVLTAFDAGYRSIDTAQFYQNEQGVGKAIQDSNLNREDIFVTTKVWNSHHGYKKTLEAFEQSMDQLQLDYLDLYLIHWPMPLVDEYIETYTALEKLYKDGRVKAIGVSNFNINHLEKLLKHTDITPAINQVECHPFLQQGALKAFCESNDIKLEAWSPLARGKVIDNPVIMKIAKKHQKTPAQITLRWHIEQGHILIPKSVTPTRIQENIDVFHFSLDQEDHKQIARLESGYRVGSNPKDMNTK